MFTLVFSFFIVKLLRTKAMHPKSKFSNVIKDRKVVLSIFPLHMLVYYFCRKLVSPSYNQSISNINGDIIELIIYLSKVCLSGIVNKKIVI